VEVLAGLTRTFTAVAFEKDLGNEYQLRFKDVKSSSIHLIFEAVAFAKANPAAATAIAAGAAVIVNATTNTVSGAYRVITDIAKIIDAKKKLKGTRVATRPTAFTDEGVVLTAPEELIVLTRKQYELLLSQRVDRSLAQIVSPLAPKRIDSFQMRRATQELVTVDARQRDYFDYVEVSEEQSREGNEIMGTLNSLTKTSLRGTFYTTDGIHVPYKYSGGDIAQLFRGFSSREPVRVRGRIKYGSDGIPDFVDVHDIEFLQREIFAEDIRAFGTGPGRKFRDE
jgi:hypothetical protein